MAEATRENSPPDDRSSSSDAGGVTNRDVVYFCHKCSREVEGVGSDFVCPRCNSGFLEIIERDTASSVDALRRSSSGSFQSQDEQNGAVDFEEFMRHFAYPILQNIIHNPQRQDQQQAFRPSAPTPGQNPPSTVGFSFSSSNPSASASGPQAPQQQQQQQQQPAPLFQGFFQNLFEGLTNGGVFQVQFQMDNGEGRQHFAFPMPLHGSPGDYAWGPGGLDAIVTQLLNQVEGGSPPMTREKIENLPDVEITKEQTEKRLQCAVCMDEFQLSEKVKQLACEHLFHIDCIKPWLERHNSCPVCRKSAEPDRNDGHDRNQPGDDPSNSSGRRPTSFNEPRSTATTLQEIDELD